MPTELVTQAEVEKIVPAVQLQARAMVVSDSDSYELACAFLQLVATRKKQVDDVFNPIVQKAHEAHKEALSQKNKFMNPLMEAEVAVKGKVSRYRTDQERIRREEEQRRQEEARKAADEVAMAQAAELQAQGEPELAEMVIEEAAQAPPPVVVLPTSVPKVDNVAGRKFWKYRTINEALIPREYLMVNHAALGAVARSQKNLAKIPGVEVYSEETVAVRSA